MNFDQAFDRLLGNEGGLSMDPNDPGNWTGGHVGVGGSTPTSCTTASPSSCSTSP